MINLLFLYKDYQIAYFVSAFLLLFPLLFGAVFTGNMWLALLGFLLLFADAFLFRMLAKKRFQKYTDLYNNCQIAEYLKASEQFLSKAKNPAYTEYFKNSIFAACMMQPDFARAGRVLTGMQPVSQNPQNEMVYYSNLCVYFTKTQNFSQAQAALDSLKSMLNRPKLPEVLRTLTLHQIETCTQALQSEQGNYDGAKTFWENELLGATTTLQKVVIHAHLQDICLHENLLPEAKEHAAFILQNGGDTYFVKDAERVMQMPDLVEAELSAQEPLEKQSEAEPSEVAQAEEHKAETDHEENV